MFRNIKEPGGVIGAFTVGATVLLFLSGLLSVMITVRNDQGFGRAELTAWAIIGAGTWLGCVGFAMGRDRSTLGCVLAVVGALAFATFYFWALLPLLLGPAIALLAVLRARRLASPPARLATA